MCFKELITLLALLQVAAKPLKNNSNANTLSSLNNISTQDHQTNWEHLNKTCLFGDCDEQVNLKHLHQIANYMDRDVHPCENFHAYACSYWKEKHPQQKAAMTMGEQQLNDKFDKIFSTAKTNEIGPNSLADDLIKHKMQHYLEVCLQSERKEKASWTHYIRTLRGLGYLQFNNDTNWLTTLREFNLFSNSRFFISLQIERFNVSRYMLSIEPHNILENVNFSIEAYEILKMYTNDSFVKLSQDFEQLELDLSNILKTPCLNSVLDENSDCDLTQWLSYDELLKKNTSLKWEYLLADFPLELKDQIFVNDFKNLEKLHTYLNQASQKTLFLYGLTHFINYLKLHKHNIVDKGSGRQSCLRHMRKHFPLISNYLYDRVYYDPKRLQSDNVILQIFSQLKEQFNRIIDTNEMQLPKASLQYLKRKIHHLTLNIGNLPLNASQHFYTEYISDFNVTQDFYLNHLMALKHFFKRQRLLSSRSKFENFWYTFNLHMPNFLDNIDSTAYYFTTANTIILPFAYLQLPFFDHRFWPSLLFGDLANTLGHELIHAFDIKFLENDFAGNFNDQDASSILSNKLFQQNIACLRREPTKYLTERIADISGTHLALRTFTNDPQFLKNNGKLFFLQFAQFFCGSAESNEFLLEDDAHDLDSLRLNYTLSHMPEFAEVFQCPVGSAMNPAVKCKLW